MATSRDTAYSTLHHQSCPCLAEAACCVPHILSLCGISSACTHQWSRPGMQRTAHLHRCPCPTSRRGSSAAPCLPGGSPASSLHACMPHVHACTICVCYHAVSPLWFEIRHFQPVGGMATEPLPVIIGIQHTGGCLASLANVRD